MLILGIESSCDETAVALVEDGKHVIAHAIASSADIHRLYGGVFPELACRRHSEVIFPLINKVIEQGRIPDAIAVANSPGLIGALLIGLQTAKGLSIAWNKPLIGVNHVEAHLYASMMEEDPLFPALGFVLSGGHTLMMKISGIGSYELLGSTVDDAIGEAFDKTATLLGLSYPGGPELERLAEKGDPDKVRFSSSVVKKNPLAFSFSGLKTAVLYALKTAEAHDLAASFQKAACQEIIKKARLALKTTPCRSIIFGGGVCCNRFLRKSFSEAFSDFPLFWPPEGLSQDNAIMIAGLAYHQFLKKGADSLNLEALPRNEKNRYNPFKH